MHTIRVCLIEAATWAHDTEHGVLHVASFQWSCQVDGEWKDSTNHGLQDLAVLGQVSRLALDWIHQQAESDRG